MVELVNVVKKLPRPEEEDENDEQLTKKGKRGFYGFLFGTYRGEALVLFIRYTNGDSDKK